MSATGAIPDVYKRQIFPCIPAYYANPKSSSEMAKEFAYRVLAHIGLPQPGAYVWKPEE